MLDIRGYHLPQSMDVTKEVGWCNEDGLPFASNIISWFDFRKEVFALVAVQPFIALKQKTEGESYILLGVEEMA